MHAKWGIGILAVFFLLGCNKEEAEEIAPAPTVDAELEYYMQTFEWNAAVYGLDVSEKITSVSATLEALDGNIAGQCTSFSGGAGNNIRIDDQFWQQADFYLREFVMYHELGHCVLDRPHLDAETTDGRCISIMNSGTSDCINDYGPLTRARYFEELFTQ